jgi:flagellar biosynthesis regulator FlaF
MQTDELLINPHAFHLNEEPIPSPAVDPLPIRTRPAEEPPSEHLFLWGVLILLLAFLAFLAVIASRLYRDGLQTNAQVQSSMAAQAKALGSLQSGISQASKSAQAASEQSSEAVRVARTAQEAGDRSTKRVDTIQYNQRLLASQIGSIQQELGELKKRLPAATITGTISAEPKPAQTNSIGAVLDQMIQQGRDLKRVKRPGAAEDSWLVSTTDGKTVDAVVDGIRLRGIAVSAHGALLPMLSLRPTP